MTKPTDKELLCAVCRKQFSYDEALSHKCNPFEPTDKEPKQIVDNLPKTDGNVIDEMIEKIEPTPTDTQTEGELEKIIKDEVHYGIHKLTSADLVETNEATEFIAKKLSNKINLYFKNALQQERERIKKAIFKHEPDYFPQMYSPNDILTAIKDTNEI